MLLRPSTKTSRHSHSTVTDLARLRKAVDIEALPIAKTTTYGHFGVQGRPWEKIVKI